MAIFFGIIATAFVLWGALALHFAGPRGGAVVLPIVWTVGTLGILVLVRPLGRRMVFFAGAAAALLMWWSTIRPSNERPWQPDVARPPYAQLHGDELTVHNVRNFDYRSETDFTEHWETRTYDLAKLDRLDFFMSYWGSPSIAHTIMSWAFTDGQHLAVSIETRKEVGRRTRQSPGSSGSTSSTTSPPTSATWSGCGPTTVARTSTCIRCARRGSACEGCCSSTSSP